MYLSRKTYVKNWDHHEADERHNVTVKKGGETLTHIKPERVSYVIEEIGCWRKANQIHKWFVDECQDGVDECQESYVEKSDLETLLGLCERIMEDKSLAESLLPAQSGFFFGGTEYDEWYFQGIQQTIDFIKPILEDEGCFDYYYRSSW